MLHTYDVVQHCPVWQTLVFQLWLNIVYCSYRRLIQVETVAGQNILYLTIVLASFKHRLKSELFASTYTT